MKILLINPPAENTLPAEVPDIINEERGHNPPLGLLYIASSLLQAGHKVEVLDAQAEETDYAGIEARIAKTRPDMVGISAMSFTLIDALLAAKAVKNVDKGIKVALGGPHPTIYPKETAALDDVDYAIVGEGEYAMTQLADAVEKGKAPKDVRGVAYKAGGKVTAKGSAEYIDDLDRLPFPARKLTRIKKYGSLIARRNPITTMFTSRGCPYRCLFCDRPQMGKRFRARSAGNVVDEMEECVGLGIREFLVYDDTFTVDRKRVIDICDEIGGRKLDIGFDIRARVNTVDEKMLAALKKAGCERIHYGVESGNERVLKTLRKGITLEQAEDAFMLTMRAGIDSLAYFMIGSPGETRQTVEDTIRFAVKLKPDYVHFSITTPFPATDLYRMGLETGIIESDYWLAFAKDPKPGFTPPVWEENLKNDQLRMLLRQAYRRFYLRPGYAAKRLVKAGSLGEIRRKARAAFKVARM